jgi:predicted porin
MSDFNGGTMYLCGRFSIEPRVELRCEIHVGAVRTGVAYMDGKYVALNGNSIRNWGAGAKYALGDTLMTLLYTNTRNTGNGATVNMVEAGGRYHSVAGVGLGANYMYMWGNAAVDRNHAQQLTAASSPKAT